MSIEWVQRRDRVVRTVAGALLSFVAVVLHGPHSRAIQAQGAHEEIARMLAEGAYLAAARRAGETPVPPGTPHDEVQIEELRARAEARWRGADDDLLSALAFSDAAVRGAEGCVGVHAELAMRCRLERARVHLARGEFAAADADLAVVIANSAAASDVHALGWALRAYARSEGSGDARSAQAFSDTAFELIGRGPKLKPVDEADVFNHAARVLIRAGRTPDAVCASRAAFVLLQESLPMHHPQVAGAQHALGYALQKAGDWPGAAAAFEAAVAGRTSAFGPEHPAVAGSLFLLASLRTTLGQPDEARELLTRVISSYERCRGKNAPVLFPPLRLAARLARDAGDIVAARAALEGCERLLASGVHAPPRDHASIARWFGELEFVSGNLDQAARHFADGIARLEGQGGVAEAELADLLLFHGSVQPRLGRLDEGIADLERALALRRKLHAEGHVGIAYVIEYLAPLLAERGGRGDFERAFELALEAAALALADRRAVAGREFDERTSLGRAGDFGPGLGLACILACEQPDSGRAEAAYDALVRARGVVHDELAERRSSSMRAADPEVESSRSRLVEARRALADAALLAAGGGAENEARLSVARRERERAEQEFARKCEPYREQRSNSRSGFEDVLAALAPRTVLVSWTRFEIGGQAVYVAYVVRADDGEVRCVTRVPAEELESLCRRTLGALHAGSGGKTYRSLASELRELVWDPLERHVEDAAEVLLVPDGALCWLDWAAFPVGRSDWLVEHAPPFHYLVAERDVLPGPSANDTERRGLVVVGGVDFEAEPLVHTPERGGGSGDLHSLTRLGFGHLTASLTEAEIVRASFLATHPDEPALFLSGADASEEAFARAVPRARVLHLATHGFYLDSNSTSAAEEHARGRPVVAERLPGAYKAPLSLQSDAALRSGLAFAGAQRAVRTSAGSGILFAEEVLGLDLSGVELAVLSACDTGAGDVQNGEGVFGLRRAFLLAGARTVVASLWPLDDPSAPERLREFYAGYWGRGETAARALQGAALRRLAELRTGGNSEDPRNWAGLVAVGGAARTRAAEREAAPSNVGRR